MNINPEGMINAMGMMGEVTLIMYRAAIRAGAAREEAKDIVEAYFGATIKHGDRKLKESKDED